MIDKQAIKEEKQRRARQKVDELQSRFSPSTENGFWEYLKYMMPKFFREEKILLKKLAGVLQRVSLGELKRVLISIYPRAGKSLICSYWITWDLGFGSDRTYMRNCYGETLATDLSKTVMDIMATSEYKSIFPEIKLDAKASSKLAWQIRGNTQLTYFGTGVGGSITGRGCNRASLFDDPIKNAEDGMNPAYLEKLELFYSSVIETRLDPTTSPAEIIIQTRWNENDPIGLRIGVGDWEHFSFPALDENMKSTCEAMNSTENLLKIRDGFYRAGNGWLFEALYQGIPINTLTAKFKKDELIYFKKADISDKMAEDKVCWIDYANKGKDYLSAVFAYKIEGHWYIVDVIFSNEPSEKLRPLILEKIIKHNPRIVIFESNQGGEEYSDSIEKELDGVVDTVIDSIYTSTNKEIRILVRSGAIKKLRYLDKSERDIQYLAFMNNLYSYSGKQNRIDDAPDSLAGLVGEIFQNNQATIFGVSINQENGDVTEIGFDNCEESDILDNDVQGEGIAIYL